MGIKTSWNHASNSSVFMKPDLLPPKDQDAGTPGMSTGTVPSYIIRGGSTSPSADAHARTVVCPGNFTCLQ